MNTREVARFLGVTKAMVLIHSRDGKLPFRRKHGRNEYERDDVEAFAACYSPKAQNQLARKHKGGSGSSGSLLLVARGQWAAQVFACFRQGLDLADIVIRTSCDPKLVREMWEEYQLGLKEGATVKQAAAAEKELRTSIRESRQAEREATRLAHERELAELAAATELKKAQTKERLPFERKPSHDQPERERNGVQHAVNPHRSGQGGDRRV